MSLNLDNANEIGGNDPEFLKELLSVYVKRFPEYYDTLDHAIQQEDLAEMAARIHRVKSAASVLGYHAFCQELKDTEEYCLGPEANKEKAIVRSKELLGKFMDSLEEVKTYLHENLGA